MGGKIHFDPARPGFDSGSLVGVMPSNFDVAASNFFEEIAPNYAGRPGRQR
jgi:hypothetical protein